MCIILLVDRPELKEALDELMPLATHWKKVGALLGIRQYVLEWTNEVELGPHECLQEMLSVWVKQISPPPTWAALADAVSEIETKRVQIIREVYISSRFDNTIQKSSIQQAV